jgi:F0F1-type ATP synthase assembly protein I
VDTPKEPSPERSQEKPFETYRQIAPFLSLGFQMASAVVLLFFAGRWADTSWGTSPFLQLIGVLLGSTGGLIKFFRATEEINKQQPGIRRDKKSEA